MISSRLSKLSPRERTGLLAVLVVVVAAVSDLAVVRPIWGTFQQVNRDVRLEKDKISGYARALSPERTGAIQARYDAYRPFIQKRTSLAQENSTVLGEIEGLAGQSHVAVLNTKPRDPRAVGSFQEHLVDVEIEGTMVDIASFLHAIQKSPDLLRVSRFECSPKSKEQASVMRAALAVTKIVSI